MITPISHSDKEYLLDTPVNIILHEYPEGFSYFVYSGDQVYDAFITPVGNSNVRLQVVNPHSKEKSSLISDGEALLGYLDVTAQIFADSWNEDKV